MSDWNESACGVIELVGQSRIREAFEHTHLARDNKGDRLNGGTMNFVCTCNLTIRDTQSPPREEAHAALRFR